MLRITCLFILFLFSGALVAKPIDTQTAKIVATNFLKKKTNSVKFQNQFNLQLEHIYASRETKNNAALIPVNYFYLFNVEEGGFIAVSADDIVEPILGYSDESQINYFDIPFTVAKWFQNYADQIRFAVKNQLDQTNEIELKWKELIEGLPNVQRRAGSVAPLLKTKWNQSPYYNDLCPYDNTYKKKTVTGCVATAMAQVIKYWNYPAQGSGFYSYNHNSYGTLSSSFGSHTYDYSSMPNVVTSSNNSVAQLMYDCGISVEMNYNVSEKGGSGAYVLSSESPVENCTEYALKTYFGYPETLSGKKRSNYSDATWLSMLKTELDASQPLIFAGFGSGGGHCFVADGYDNNDYIHFNWGWGGSSDGYFQMNALNPGSLGAGGGTGGFNSGQQAIFGLKPPSSNINYELTLNTSLIVNPSTINYGGFFDVTVNFTNKSSYNFSGDYCAAVFDANNNFVDFVETKTGLSLQSGYKYNNDLVFSSSGILAMLPGKYSIAVFYRPTGGNWTIVKGTFFYTNYKSITVENNNQIALNAAMQPSPNNEFTKGAKGTVTLNIVNNGSSTFTGKYKVALFNLDGTFAQDIGVLTESNGLPAGYVYSNLLSFSTNEITLNPGTYLLAAQYIPDGSSKWYLCGTGNYQNPIYVDVVEPPLNPDMYEINDNVSQAYSLNLTFSGNSGNANTLGTNCHTGEDYDFFKINLASGYNYTFSPRLHDAANSSNGNFSLDAIFSYSLDNGNTWSDAFDDVMPSNFITQGGKSILFKVAPFFSGNTGTYLLDIPVTRVSTASVAQELKAIIKLYPNPTHDIVNIHHESGKELKNLVVVDIQGREIYRMPDTNQSNKIVFSTKDWKAGIYFVTFMDDANQVYSNKFIKE